MITHEHGFSSGRWARFNIVGLIGLLVQLACLWALTQLLNVHYILATAIAVELTILTGMLAGALGRPIVNDTGLIGRFDIDFIAAPRRAGPGIAGSPLAELPSVFTAGEDQLGLKLVQRRAAIEVLVIDRLEMPTEN